MKWLALSLVIACSTLASAGTCSGQSVEKGGAAEDSENVKEGIAALQGTWV